jgi:hypothetical protein
VSRMWLKLDRMSGHASERSPKTEEESLADTR